VSPDGVAVRPAEFSIDTKRRLNAVIAGGNVFQREDREASGAAVHDGYRVRKQAVDVGSEKLSGRAEIHVDATGDRAGVKSSREGDLDTKLCGHAGAEDKQ
jgi:hypothetical protein